jgi:hypothetical protein
MACMSHACRSCGKTWFDNLARTPCPRCGETLNISDFFDEDPQEHDLDDTDVFNDNEDAY